jgi:hypothetical protein
MMPGSLSRRRGCGCGGCLLLPLRLLGLLGRRGRIARRRIARGRRLRRWRRRDL